LLSLGIVERRIFVVFAYRRCDRGPVRYETVSDFIPQNQSIDLRHSRGPAIALQVNAPS